jgi:hypothetical protein
MLLSIISQVPDAFNCSESSPQWEEVFKRMIAEFYQSGPSRLSGALHGHFVDLYSAFKIGIRNLSVVDKEKKCPVEYVAGDEVVGEYVEALNNLLCSDAKKYQSKKWWSCGVIELLLQMHIAYTSEFSGGAQTAGWLSGKATAHRTKFETDQKNRLDELAKKGRQKRTSELTQQKIVKLLQKHLHSLCRRFSSFPPHLLRLRMWEQWWNKRWLP